MKRFPGSPVALVLLLGLSLLARPAGADAGRLAATEQAFLDYLDASGAVSYLESGAVDRFQGKGLVAWKQLASERRAALGAGLAAVAAARVSPEDSASSSWMAWVAEKFKA